MPIYEYRCARCGHELEALQKLADAPLTTCPACQATGLKKKLSAAGFQLKGSGWYATDFRGGKSPKPAEGAEATKSEGKATKSESKADGGGETKSPASETPSTGGGETKAAASASGGGGTSSACH